MKNIRQRKGIGRSQISTIDRRLSHSFISDGNSTHLSMSRSQTSTLLCASCPFPTFLLQPVYSRFGVTGLAPFYSMSWVIGSGQVQNLQSRLAGQRPRKSRCCSSSLKIFHGKILTQEKLVFCSSWVFNCLGEAHPQCGGQSFLFKLYRFKC